MRPLLYVPICSPLSCLPYPPSSHTADGGWNLKLLLLSPSLFLLYVKVTHVKSFACCLAGEGSSLSFFFPGNQGSYSVPITLEVSRKIYPNKNVTPTLKLGFWA